MTTFPHRNATVACKLMVACTCVAVQTALALGRGDSAELAGWYEQAHAYYQSVQNGQSARPAEGEWQEFLDQMNWAYAQLYPERPSSDPSPGASEAERSTRRPATEAQTVPAQTKVIVMAPAVQKPQALVPCEAGSKTIDRESGRITFGDGEHGRVPQSTQDYCLARDAQAELADGDPDQPVVTGRVPNSKKKEK